ncbi:hypothetical protein ACFU8Q_01705 [Streptomyces sp. NPDC057543]|uniref:hypothetical protein n=1 Tax=Streptomyces sp. NPDC057543 TaxID=3346163 RepID=UPI0036AA2ADC
MGLSAWIRRPGDRKSSGEHHRKQVRLPAGPEKAARNFLQINAFEEMKHTETVRNIPQGTKKNGTHISCSSRQ